MPPRQEHYADTDRRADRWALFAGMALQGYVSRGEFSRSAISLASKAADELEKAFQLRFPTPEAPIP